MRLEGVQVLIFEMMKNFGNQVFFGSQDFIFLVNDIFLTHTGMGYHISQSFKKKIKKSKNGSQDFKFKKWESRKWESINFIINK